MIGIHGKLGSGKDTVLERMQVIAPGVFAKASFAAKLKESAAALFGVTVDELEEWKRNDLAFVKIEDMRALGGTVNGEHICDGQIVAPPFTVRTMLQRYGTEAHREVFGDNFWVDQAMTVVDRYDTIPVFTDVRFENEALAIRERGGVIVRVIGDYQDTGDHASEVPLPSSLVDFRIDNSRRDDNFAALDRHVQFLIDSIGVPA